MAEQRIPENDPIVTKSYAKEYLIASVLLLGTLFWALWDEAYGQRPWKHYQAEFQQRYTAFLARARSDSAGTLKDIQSSAAYQDLADAAKAAKQASAAQEKAIAAQIVDVDAQTAAVQAVYTDKKALFGADTYAAETSTFDDETARVEKKKHDEKVAELEKEKDKPQYEIDLPSERGKKYSYNQLEEKYLGLKNRKAELVAQLAEAQKPWKEAEAKRDAYVTNELQKQVISLSPSQLEGLRNKYASWDPQIVQINVAEANIVDRCESCHMGTREPVTLTAAAMTPKGMKKPDALAVAFVSHPERDLLSIHDPEKFGCSPCHNGNGRATTSVEKAHGTYEHWLRSPAGSASAS